MFISVFLLLFLLTVGDAKSKQETFWKKAFDVMPPALSIFGLTPAGTFLEMLREELKTEENSFESKVLYEFELQKKISQESSKQIINTIAQLIHESELRNHLNSLLNDYNKNVSNEIEALRNLWFKILNSKKRFENKTLINFAEHNIKGNYVTKIFQYLRGAESEHEAIHHGNSLLNIVKKALGETSSDNFCSLILSTSPQQTILNYFNEVTLMQLYAYLMTLHSYEILKTYQTNDQNYSSEINSFIESSKGNFERSAQMFIKISKETSREFWKCNPINHIEDETFLEASKTFQAVVHRGGEKCDNVYSLISPSGFFETRSIGVCNAGFASSRRYDFIEVILADIFESGEKIVYGSEFKSCHSALYKAENDEMMMSENQKLRISVCFNKDSRAHRYFDLKPVLSDVTNNRVVTGVRFKKVKKVFRLEIQQGELSGRGQIKQSTVEWKMFSNTDFKRQLSVDGDEIFKLEKNKNKIEFSDNKIPIDYVVTGVSFYERDGVIKLSTRGNKIDFETGKIFESAQWFNGSSRPKSELKLCEPDLPTSSVRSAPVSEKDQFIKFTYSDFKKDAAQSTVPFFDAQNVVSEPNAVPLQGIDLFLKGEKGSGGFLSLKIKTFDYLRNYEIYSNRI